MSKLETIIRLVEYNLDLKNQIRNEEVTIIHSVIGIVIILILAIFSNSIISAIVATLYFILAYIIYPILFLRPSADDIRRIHRILILLKISKTYYKENIKNESILGEMIKEYHRNYINNKPFKRKKQKEFLNFLENKLDYIFKKFSPSSISSKKNNNLF